MAAINKAAKPQWLSRTLAGTCLGFTLALALSGVFVRLAPDAAGKVQMAMWLMPPVWLAVASLAFLFRDGWRASAWLAAANVAAWGLLFLLPPGSSG